MASFPVFERKYGVKKGFLAPGANPSLPTLSKTSQLAAPGDYGSFDARNSTIDRELRDCIAGHTYRHTDIRYSFIYIDKPATARFARSSILVAKSVKRGHG